MAKETVEELQKFLPKSIDDVVRENRDKLPLALATENELKAVETTIANAPVRHQLAGWNVLMLQATTASGQVSSPRLIGRVAVERFINLDRICTELHHMAPDANTVSILATRFRL